METMLAASTQRLHHPNSNTISFRSAKSQQEPFPPINPHHQPGFSIRPTMRFSQLIGVFN